MRLTVVGCSGSYPGPESPASCYLVQAEHEHRTWQVLLDLGSGALGYLQRYTDPLRIDAVFLSHLHADHFFDLSGYYVMRKYHPDGPQARIPVYGPSDTARRVAEAYGLPEQPGMNDEFDFHVYGKEPVRVGPFTIDVAQVNHPVEAYAIRVTENDRTLVYSGDTGPCRSLPRFCRGADLVLAEASFMEGDNNPRDLHMTGRQAAQAAAEAEARSLVLTHIPPWYDSRLTFQEAREAFDGPLSVATSGATYDI